MALHCIKSPVEYCLGAIQVELSNGQMSELFMAKGSKETQITYKIDLKFPVKKLLSSGGSTHNIKVAFLDKNKKRSAYLGDKGSSYDQ